MNFIFKHILDKFKPENIYIFSASVLLDKIWRPYLKMIDKIDPDLLYTNIYTNMDGLIELYEKL